ncbi:MAG TPA: hypothetical protein VFE62_09290, partial [Gemmataceae bacterium]|nr:hypothetical protein [Gemmataceae bacterium]
MFDAKHEALPDRSEVIVDRQTCRSECSEIRNDGPTCPAFQLVQLWWQYQQGYLTTLEATNRMWDFPYGCYDLLRKQDEAKAKRFHRERDAFEMAATFDLLG